MPLEAYNAALLRALREVADEVASLQSLQRQAQAQQQATTAAERCTCGNACNCRKTCRCGGGCGCASTK